MGAYTGGCDQSRKICSGLKLNRSGFSEIKCADYYYYFFFQIQVFWDVDLFPSFLFSGHARKH